MTCLTSELLLVHFICECCYNQSVTLPLHRIMTIPATTPMTKIVMKMEINTVGTIRKPISLGGCFEVDTV